MRSLHVYLRRGALPRRRKLIRPVAAGTLRLLDGPPGPPAAHGALHVPVALLLPALLVLLQLLLLVLPVVRLLLPAAVLVGAHVRALTRTLHISTAGRVLRAGRLLGPVLLLLAALQLLAVAVLVLVLVRRGLPLQVRLVPGGRIEGHARHRGAVVQHRGVLARRARVVAGALAVADLRVMRYVKSCSSTCQPTPSILDRHYQLVPDCHCIFCYF